MKKVFRRLRVTGKRALREWRRFYWSLLVEEMGRGVKYWGKVHIEVPERVRIGNHCTFNEGAVINGRGTLVIEDHVRIGAYAMLQSGGLDYLQPRESRGHLAAPIVVKAGAWICAGAVINAGVTIGEDAVVGPGSVVMQDVPPETFVFGVPARVMRAIPRAPEAAPQPAS